MMRRLSLLLLEAALLLSTVAALVYFVRVLVSSVTHADWFWGGALAAAAGPALIAAALWLLGRATSVKLDHYA